MVWSAGGRSEVTCLSWPNSLGRSASRLFTKSACALLAASSVRLLEGTGNTLSKNSSGRHIRQLVRERRGARFARAHTSLYNFLSTERALPYHPGSQASEERGEERGGCSECRGATVLGGCCHIRN